MKAQSIFKTLLVAFIFVGCKSSTPFTESPSTPGSTENSLLLVPGQRPLPQSIKGLQLYRKNYAGSPPVIRLGSQDQLLLRFDELAALSGQFGIKFSHRNQDWSASGLADIWIYEGVNDLTLQGGRLNEQSLPNYFSYSYEFPNREIQFLVSGNYLVTITDFQSGTELFSLPFFVTENAGELEPSIETFFNAGPLGSAMDQLNISYFYPDFVEFPQFNLSYRFAQNRFWENSITPKQTNFVQEGKTTARLTRDQFFPAYIEFNTLDLRLLSLQNPQIFGYDRAEIPERVILRDDYFNFSSDLRTITETGFGRPVNDLDARMLHVLFRYETQGALRKDSQIYLLGDFNQWTINNRFKLTYNSQEGLFEVNALIKQGLYNYSYAVVEDGRINFLRNLETLTQKPQEYAGFVYYKDPQLQYDRLLSVRVLYSE